MKSFKKTIRNFFLVAILISILCLGIYGYSKISFTLELRSANNISLYDIHDEMFFRGSGMNEWISLDEISPYLINATISTEDKNFYNHFGFDFARILKASYVNITSRSKKQGASTISQQYVKNLFLDFDKTWERKWNELWLTLNVELHYTKEEILEGYLNTINYGHGMYGIENASWFYFNKSASDLSLAEASILVGIPKSPSNYSPIVNYDLAKKRQLMILEGMVKNKYITEEEKDSAYQEKLTFVGKKNSISLSTALYYQDAVLKELASIPSIPKSFLDTGGLKIYTNFDIDAQTILEEKMEKNLKDNEKIQVSAMMMNPNTGGIIALIGGRDFAKSQYNRAVSSVRQVGSAMKPLLYYAALENGFTPSTTFTSEQTTFTFSNNKTYSPKNASEIYGNKPISMAAAIAYSDNVYAVKTHLFLGEDMLVQMAKRLGITSKLEAVPSLALGTNEINMIEITTAYAAFANLGYKVIPHFIRRVEDINGNVLYEVDDTKELVLNSSLAFILNDLLTTTYDKNFIDYNYPTVLGIASKLSRKYSIKSGTTDTDSWTIGFTPDLITSVWVGYDDNSSIETSDYMYTKNIFADTMEAYLKGKEDHWYSMPSNVVGMLVDPISGSPITTNSNKKRLLYYLRGSEPFLNTSVSKEESIEKEQE